MEVPGETVGEVDRCRGDPPVGERAAELDHRARVEKVAKEAGDLVAPLRRDPPAARGRHVPVAVAAVSAQDERESRGRGAERSGDPELVARLRATPAKRPYLGDAAEDRDGGEPLEGGGEVPADDRDGLLPRRGAKSVEEAVQPRERRGTGKAERQERVERGCPHGGEVGEVYAERLAPDEEGVRAGREIFALHQGVGADGEAGGCGDHGGVVADAHPHVPATGREEPLEASEEVVLGWER